MARRALGPATLLVVQAVEAALAPPSVRPERKGNRPLSSQGGVDGALLVACSGGADSLALAAAAAIVARRTVRGVRAAIVDHGLQAGSAAQAAAVVDRLATLGVPAQVLAVNVASEGEGIEAAAREARYTALQEHARPGEVVLLGHTLDDQAETVLLGLARGSGTRSLAGMPARRGRFLRPLLGLRATTTRQACAELGLEPWRDPHNAEPRFARVRVRERLLPVLEAELGPGVAEALARGADLARDDADLLDQLAGRELDRLTAAPPALAPGADLRSDAPPGRLPPTDAPPADLDCAGLADLPGALRSRVVRAWLRAGGAPEVTAVHVRAVDALVTDWHGQVAIDVPGVRVARIQGRLRILPPMGAYGAGSGPR